MNYTAKEYINALFALDNGWTGKDVLVGVLDDGVKEVGELSGQISDLSKDYGTITENGVTVDRNVLGDENSSHGTAVAGIIAALRNGIGTSGIAPDAKIVNLRVDSIDKDKDKIYIGQKLETAIKYAADNGVKIINMSLGPSIPLDEMKPSSVMIDAVTYLKNAGTLLVASTGNSSESSPRNYVNVTADNAEGWLFVAALTGYEKNYDMAGYSNKCGVVAARCVVSVGSNASIGLDNQLVGFGGTSSAAPVVSALGALILSKWPQLSGVDAGNVIISTAKDLGAAGVDEIYGAGLVDVEAALSPVNPTISNGTWQAPLSQTYAVMSSAFGDYEGTAFRDVTIIDSFGRDFTGDLSGLVVKPSEGKSEWLQRRMEAQANSGGASFITPTASGVVGYTGYKFGFNEEDMAYQLTSANFVYRLGGTHITASLNSEDNVLDDVIGLAPTSDAMFAHSALANMKIGVSQPFADGRLGISMVTGNAAGLKTKGGMVDFENDLGSLKVGLLDESGTVYGTPTGTGALRFGNGAQTTFIEAGSGFDTGSWAINGYASLAATQLKVSDDTLLTDASMQWGGRMGFTASRSLWNGRMSLGVAQPLTILKGNGTYTVGSGYDLAARSLLFSDRTIDMSGRIMPRVTLGYEQMGTRSSLRMGVGSNADGSDARAVGTWTNRF